MAATESKAETLWNLQLQLKSCLFLPETEIDPYISALFPSGPPEWLDNSLIYAPLLQIFDEKIERMCKKIEQSQRSVQILLKSRQSHGKKSDDADKRRIEAIQADISQLSDESKQNESNLPDIITKFQSMQAQIDEEAAILQEMREEHQEIEGQLQECIDQSDVLNKERDALLDQLKKSTAAYRQYRLSNKEMEEFIQQIIQHRNILYKREKELTDTISQLEATAIESKKAIALLEEKAGKHQTLIADHQQLDPKLTRLVQSNEAPLQKLMDSVKQAEEWKSEAEKQKLIKDSISDEARRLKDLVLETNRKFSEEFGLHEVSIRRQFDKILSDIEDRSKKLEEENQNTASEVAILKKKIESKTREKESFKNSRNEEAFNEYLVAIRSLDSKAEDESNRRNQLLAENSRIYESINVLKGRIADEGRSSKRYIADIQNSSEKIEMEIERNRNGLLEISKRNSELSADNKCLRSQIVEVRESGFEYDLRPKKVSEAVLNEIAKKEDEASKSLVAVQLSNKQMEGHKEKWRNQSQRIKIEAGFAIKEAESKLNDWRTRIKILNDARQMKDNGLRASKMEISSIEQEISSLKEKISDVHRKIERRSEAIEKSTASNLRYNQVSKELQRALQICDDRISEQLDQSHKQS